MIIRKKGWKVKTTSFSIFQNYSPVIPIRKRAYLKKNCVYLYHEYYGFYLILGIEIMK